MTKIVVSKEARKDIVSMATADEFPIRLRRSASGPTWMTEGHPTSRQYIHDELSNPDASQRVIAALKKSIQSLTDFSSRGRPLDALIPVHTEYRYLVCENYCVFYLASSEEVIIVRILHQRQDCLKALFIEK